MKKISLGIILTVLVVFLLWGCVKSTAVPVEQKPQVAEQSKVTHQVVERPAVISKKPDSNVWGHLGKTRSGDSYYKKTSINKSSGIIEVRTYKIVAEDFRKAAVEEAKKNDPAKSIKYRHYDHNIRVDEIDCRKNLYRVVESIDYDDHGNVLESYAYKNEPWKSIPVLTGLDAMREKFCVSQTQPLKKKK